jgi:DUF4097 and DUF4098 domain-containing protein YvlB
MYYVPPPRRHSVVGPLILIGIGVWFLLRNFGYSLPLLSNFVKYWPLLLVVVGVVLLAEYFAARSAGRPAPSMGGGTVFLLVMVVIFGGVTSAVYHSRNDINWGSLRDNVDMDENLMHLFGSEYTFDGNVEQQLPAGGAVRVNCERGNITLNNWEQSAVKVVYHKRVFAGSQGEADSTNRATAPRVQMQGTSVEVEGNTEGAGAKGVATDLEIFVPLKANVELMARRGDVSVTQRTGDVKLTAERGDATLDQVTGNVNVTTRHGSLHASNVTGNVTVDGRLDDLSLDTIAGLVTITADIFGDTRLSKLQKGVAIRTSRTELEMARLDGDLTMDSGDLQGSGLQGPVTLSTKAKDIDLHDLKGDVHISDDRGNISVDTGSEVALGNLDLTTHHGDVHLRLPAKASFQYQVVTRHGEISSEFENVRAESHTGTSTATGTVGKGGVSVHVTSDTGDINIGKSSKADAAPPAVPAPPSPPAVPAKPGKHAKKVGDVDVM